MRRDFFPDRESEMLQWARNFLKHMAVDHEALGISQALVDLYAQSVSEFADALADTANPAEKSQTKVARKNAAKRGLERLSRSLARVAGGQPNLLDSERIKLGLNVRTSPRRSVPPPDIAPTVLVRGVLGNRITIELTNHAGEGSPQRRAPGAAGANLWFFAGEFAPASRDQWISCGNATARVRSIDLPCSIPAGTKVWLCAAWYSPRGESGPVSNVVSTHTNWDALPLGTRARAA